MNAKDLASIPLFASLPPDEIESLKSTLKTVKVQAGKVILNEGHSDNKFYILMEGQVEIIKSLGKEEERILGVRGTGTLLGEMSLFSKDGRHTASVRSLTPLFLLRVTHSELDSLLHRQPRLAYEMFRLFSRRLEESENITILDLKEKNQQLREAYDELKAAHLQIIEKEKLEKELEISGEIQQSILPDSLPNVPGYDFGALMIPARQVGGDFYTFLNIGKNKLGIVVGDVSDKGVPAALFMALSYSLIRAETARTNSPVQALRKVNYHLLQMNSSNMFVTLVYGILDISSGDFHFARSAHPTPFLMDGKGKDVVVPVNIGQPLGLFDDPLIDEQHTNLPSGGTLLIYSDGVNETRDMRGKEYGTSKLSKTIYANRKLPAQKLCDQLWQSVQSHGEGISQQDDFTTVAVKRLAG